MDVGNRIRLLREEAGLSQNELAGRASVSQTHLRRVELGVAGITVDKLQLICDVLGVSMKEFFDEYNDKDELSQAVATLTPKQKQLLTNFIKSL